MKQRESDTGGHEAPEYPRGLRVPAFEFEGKQLFIDDELEGKMHHALATFGGEYSAIIDGRAFDIVYRACGGGTAAFDRGRFEGYLRAITDFEIHHSGDQERHEHRLPVEEEILRIVTEGGYFKE